MNKFKLLLRLFLVLIIASLAWPINRLSKPDINCQARTVIHNSDSSINLKTVLHTSSNHNFFELLITYTNSREESQKIHRVVTFSYDRDGDIYKMFSDATNDNALSPSVRNELNDFLPDFYLMPQRGLRLKIDKTKNGNYIILNDRLPVFLCIPIDS
jgi:hypothetical protein